MPRFEHVVGVSLLGSARMRLRRYPHVRRGGEAALALDLAPRSIYAMSGAARWNWQHAISPTRALRYSIAAQAARLTARAFRSTVARCDVSL